MTGFKHKRILSTSRLGAWLVVARLAKGWELDVLEEKTGVAVNYWVALEEGRYEDLPGKIYAMGFIKQYAELVGLDVERAQTWLVKEYRGNTTLKKPPTGEQINKRTWITHPRLISIGASVLAVVAVGLYFGLSFLRSTSLPNLQIIYPASDMITQEREIEIVGRAASETQVKINNQAVSCDAGGGFKEKFILQEGLNTILVTASRKHSREATVTRKIIMDSSEQVRREGLPAINL